MTDIVIALDLPDPAAALGLVDSVGGDATWYKVGPVLFVVEGPHLVRELVARDRRVFLDLKWHDIPSTVAGAVKVAAALGVSLATVHLSGGKAMIEAAQSARGAGLRLLGVGVLTSLDAADYGAAVGRPVKDMMEEQERLVTTGLRSGLDGFVCAAPEARRLRELAGPGALIVTPGIRRSSDPASDQRRTATPREAREAGADLIVVGRPVTSAADPGAAVRSIREELSG